MVVDAFVVGAVFGVKVFCAVLVFLLCWCVVLGLLAGVARILGGD